MESSKELQHSVILAEQIMALKNLFCLMGYFLLGILTVLIVLLAYRYVCNLASESDLLGGKGIVILGSVLGLSAVVLLGSWGGLKGCKRVSRVGDWFLRFEIGFSLLIILVGVLIGIFAEL